MAVNLNCCYLNNTSFLKLPKLKKADNVRFRITASLKVKETFYIGHGTPSVAVDDSIPVRDLFKNWRQQTYSQTPTSILIISAHWQTDQPSVTAVDHYRTIHDFEGPDHLFKLQYPAPGAPDTAKQVQQLLIKSGFDQVHLDKERGLDHGAWVPLMVMYPDADIPVCQLSVQPHLEAKHHYKMGQALAPLRDQGVLIIGSGKATHNLNELDFKAKEVAPWAAEFDKWLEESLINGRYEDVNDYEKKAPHAKRAHPLPDHLYPLHVAMGAAGKDSKAELIHRSWIVGTISYASYKFTSPR